MSTTDRTDRWIDWAAFEQVELRVGTVIGVDAFPEARKPAFKLEIDFGEPIGRLRSSAQITALYSPDELLGSQVLAVVNFPPRQIGPMRSEILVLGLPDENGEIVLIGPDQAVPVGGRMH